MSFPPNLVILIAGFDARRSDPLGNLKMTHSGLEQRISMVPEHAATACGGRVVSLLAGGYDVETSARNARRHCKHLASGWDQESVDAGIGGRHVRRPDCPALQKGQSHGLAPAAGIVSAAHDIGAALGIPRAPLQTAVAEMAAEALPERPPSASQWPLISVYLAQNIAPLDDSSAFPQLVLARRFPDLTGRAAGPHAV